MKTSKHKLEISKRYYIKNKEKILASENLQKGGKWEKQ